MGHLECRPVGDLGLTTGGIPDDAITVSGTELGYPKEVKPFPALPLVQ